MRIAVFCPYLPAPPVTGGRIRMHRLALRVLEHAELHLFTMASRTERSQANVDAELARYDTHTVAPYPHLSGLSLRKPNRVLRGAPPSNARAFARAHRTRPFDVIWVEHAYGARIAASVGLPWLLDEHNVESRFLESTLATRGPIGPVGRWRIATMRAWEQRMWRLATKVLCVTDRDADEIESIRGARPPVVPNGVDVDRVRLTLPSKRTGQDVLFVGLMNHAPNEEAARGLVQSVMPKVWNQVPEARLILCGANPSRRVRALAGPRVTVTGTVPSVEPYLAGARVYANYLQRGAGSSLKVLEALASGIPLVSTSVGVRGFDLIDGQHFVRAEANEDFARAVIRALSTGPNDPRAHAGRCIAEAHRWEVLAEAFWNHLQDTARPPVVSSS